MRVYLSFESCTLTDVTDPVNPRRAYNGQGRQARTTATRLAVTSAARRLFAERGYAAATIEAISEASGTPQATVYRLFGGKLGILTALLDIAAAGDDEAIAMGDRPAVRDLLAHHDPREQLAGFARLAREVMARLAPIQRILLSAAGSDPQAATLLAEHTRQRQTGQARIAHALAKAGALRPGVTERDAADVIHALMSPEVYLLLTGDRRWSPDRYQAWLADTLSQQLLGSAPKYPANSVRS
jgi:AcrR family transcriptional regulator